MEFEAAARRLQNDHAKLRGSSGRKKNIVLSNKAKRQAEYRKKQQEILRRRREEKKRQFAYVSSYYRSCDRKLGYKSLLSSSSSSNHATSTTTSGSSSSSSSSLTLKSTSIHGDGDKIALPPSVLEFLTKEGTMEDNYNNNNGGMSPWTFRIGILNPNYVFPSSSELQNLTPPKNDDDFYDTTIDNNNREDYDRGDDGDSDNDDDDDDVMEIPYMKELDEKYISYTHGTVVEFTQDEGYIGLPKLIASALIHNSKEKKKKKEKIISSSSLDKERDSTLFDIPITRTVDPASVASSSAAAANGDNNIDNAMDIDENDDNGDGIYRQKDDDDDEEENKTPGHLAYGKFDVPDTPIEISLVKLPKGRECTLVPTKEAVRNGFYNLKDIKLVLEQSLVRTRATLSVNDTVCTWHRGIRYDLSVTKVVPSAYRAVSCINTDIEVDIGERRDDDEEQKRQQKQKQQRQSNEGTPTATTTTTTTTTTSGSGGYTLSGGAVNKNNNNSNNNIPTNHTNSSSNESGVESQFVLKEEPPMGQKEGICTVQIRTPGGKLGRRRFDVNVHTMKDLFLFAESVIAQSPSTFRLVTRFPRKIYEMNDASDAVTLIAAGIPTGQESFMIEKL